MPPKPKYRIPPISEVLAGQISTCGPPDGHAATPLSDHIAKELAAGAAQMGYPTLTPDLLRNFAVGNSQLPPIRRIQVRDVKIRWGNACSLYSIAKGRDIEEILADTFKRTDKIEYIQKIVISSEAESINTMGY